MSITLQTASCQRYDDYRALKQREILQSILFLQRALSRSSRRSSTRVAGCCLGEYTYSVQSFQPSDLLCRIQPIHHGKLNVHQNQVESALAPLLDCHFTIRSTLPSNAETFHERLE